MKKILTESDKTVLLFEFDSNVLLDLIDSVEQKIIERIGESVATREWNDVKCKYDFCTDGNNETPLYAIPFLEDE